MRTIKFRGKRIDTGEWVYGYYAYLPDVNKIDEPNRDSMPDYKHYILNQYFDIIEVISETVGQFTGLKDKNGVEIYEGDLVKHVIESSFSKQRLLSSKSYQVLWCNQESRFYIDNTFKSGMIFKGYEVIGNIHERSEK